MRLQIDREVWNDAKKFKAFHHRWLDSRKKLGKLPRLVVDTKDDHVEYGTSRLGDFVTNLFTDTWHYALNDAKTGSNLNEQLIQNLYLTVLNYIRREMLVSDSEAYERIGRIMQEVKKVKPVDGIKALYAAYSKALLST